jgi:signal transduction histidine kinase
MLLSSQFQKRLFILGSFIVLLLSVLLYSRINALVDSFNRVDHTNKVESNLKAILSYLITAETSQRGFLLTRDSSFLQPYFTARPRIDSATAEVKRLTSEDQKQQQNIVSLQNLIDKRFYLLNNTLAKRDSPSRILNFNLSLGKMSMERIQIHVDSMRKIERNLLKERESQKELYERLTPLSLLFLVFAMLTIIGFSYYGLTQQLQLTRKTAADLDYLNHELLLKNKQLENSVEELNSFNYIASHDLKEPLRKILFFTDVIAAEASKGALSPPMEQYLEKIRSSGERMKALLDDLLVYAQASMTERKKEPVDLNVLLATIVESLSEQVNERRASVQYKDLPVLQAIPSQMHQLFENLISNSIKYSKEDVLPVITIQNQVVSRGSLPTAFEAAYEQYHKISFSDNGIGFTQDNAEKIFMLFQRLHQRHEFSGTGIGLTICKKIVQNHDGFICAESEVDKGTTFTIYLPA